MSHLTGGMRCDPKRGLRRDCAPTERNGHRHAGARDTRAGSSHAMEHHGRWIRSIAAASSCSVILQPREECRQSVQSARRFATSSIPRRESALSKIESSRARDR